MELDFAPKILDDGIAAWRRPPFARAFVRAAGASLAPFLMQIRMARAAQSLAEGTRSVGEIAEAVGYKSEAAFNRVFKRSYGIGPGQYRRHAKTFSGPDIASEPLTGGK